MLIILERIEELDQPRRLGRSQDITLDKYMSDLCINIQRVSSIIYKVGLGHA